MTTIGDRIRIRRSTGRRGQTQYSLRGTEASRDSEANQDIPEQEERQSEEAETQAEVVPPQETVHSRRESNTNQHDPDRSSSRFSVRSIQNDHRNARRSRSRNSGRDPGNRQQRGRSARSHREDGYSSSRRVISNNSGEGRSSRRYRPYNRGLSWWDNIAREECDPLPGATSSALESQPSNPFLGSHSRSVLHTMEASRQRQDERDIRQTNADGMNRQSLPIFMNQPFQFPTEPDGSFARAMSAIACNAEVGAQGRFNLISGGSDTSKENISQALALKLNLKTTQQTNEKALADIKKSRGSSAGLKQALQARAAICGNPLDPS